MKSNEARFAGEKKVVNKNRWFVQMYTVVKKSEIEKWNKQDYFAWTKSVIDKNEW